MPTMTDKPHARATDPQTSHAAVPRLVAGNVADTFTAAKKLGRFTDATLTEQFRYDREDPQFSKNVVARNRLELEKKGLVARTEDVEDGQMVFVLTEEAGRFDG